MMANTIFVLGPTASGKTRLGVELARRLGGEILSADSRQVYRGLNIGAGKDLSEYGSGADKVPYHLIDLVGLDVEFSVFDFQRAFFETWEEVRARGKLPIVVGGSGLYLEAALSPDRLMEVPRNDELRAELEAQDRAALVARLRNLKSDLHNKTDLEVRDRTIRAIEIAEYSEKHSPEPSPPIAPLILGIRRPRSDLRTRIAARLEARIEAGLLEEVESLRKQGVDWERLELLGLEYRYVSEFLRGQIESRNDLYQKLRSAILQFAKRQETWFRRMERKGFEIHWIDRADPEKSLEWVREYL
jgi:tRNA dimethylallyltransferase